VNCHLERTTGRNLRKSISGCSHDSLSTGLDIVVTTLFRVRKVCACSEERNTYSKGLAACIGSSTLKASRVLLEGVASGAIARGSPINYDQLALSIRI